MSDTSRSGTRPSAVMGSITRRQTHVYPATGMSTYYSAGRGGSRRSSAESSPCDITYRSGSGTPSYGSLSSGSSHRHTDSPASTVSGVSSTLDTGVDLKASAMRSSAPKFRTTVKISSDKDRDSLFARTNGADTGSSGGRDSPLMAAGIGSDSRRVTGAGLVAHAYDRPARRDSLSPDVTSDSHQTTQPAHLPANTCANGGDLGTSSTALRTREEIHNRASLDRDQPNKLLRESTERSKAQSNQDNFITVSDGTNTHYPATSSSYVSGDVKSSRQLGNHSSDNSEAPGMALADGIHGSYPYPDYSTAGSNGVSQHGGIDTQVPEMVLVDVSSPPPLPPRSRKSTSSASYSLLRNHAPINGSTGTQSDLSDSLDSETSSLNLDTSSATFGFPQHKFHMDQQVPAGAREDEQDSPEVGGGGQEAHPFLAGQRDILKPDEPRETKIISSKGTVRGLKNLVRAGIATFAEKNDGFKNYRQIEKGKLVVYTTSVMVVRETYERCLQAKRILHTHMVKFEERDVFMSRENQRELNERLGSDKQDVPQVFADGQHIGSFEELEKMNESGELRRILSQFQRVSRTDSCAQCGGYQYIPCPACHGSKKSQNRNYFIDEFCALRCTNCDENGLARCDLCENDDVTTS